MISSVCVSVCLLMLISSVCVSLSLSVCSELPENWTDTRETLLEGMVFQLKYLGVTLVEQPKGEELSAAAVKRIVATVSADTATATASLSVWQGHQINGDLVWSHIVTGDSRGGIGYTHDWEWFVC